MRQGASWTAAYHLQLTVAAVARPVGSSVGALGVLAAERSWFVLAQTTSARRSVQPVSSARASSPSPTLPAGTPRRRSPVCPACGVHPSGFGVRDPAVRPSAVRSPGVVVQRVRRSAVCCPPVRCPAVRCPAVRCPPRPDASVSSHAQAVAVGTRSSWPGDRDHRNGWRPLGLPGRRRLDRRSRRPPGRGRRCQSRVDHWGGRCGPGPPGWVRPRRPRCPLSDQAGQAGVGGARGGRLRGGHGSRLQREVAAPATWLVSSAGSATTVGGRRRV
jgi:hypothetical protein